MDLTLISSDLYKEIGLLPTLLIIAIVAEAAVIVYLSKKISYLLEINRNDRIDYMNNFVDLIDKYHVTINKMTLMLEIIKNRF